MTIARKITLGFAVPLAVLLIVAALATASTLHLIWTSGWVAHTHEVLANLEELLSMLQDAETGQRGYVLTGEATYREPYEKAASTWESQFDRVKQLTADNQRQQARLKDLRPAIAAKFKKMQVVIDLRAAEKGDKGFKDAVEAIKTNGGQADMDTIRHLINEMKTDEHTLLQERDYQAKLGVTLTFVSLGVGTLVAVLVVLFVGYYLVKSTTDPIRSAISHLAASSEELLAGTTQQAAGAREQAAAVAETVATVDEVTQTSDQAARRVRDLGDTVQRTLATGQSGRQVVEESITALGRVREQVESTAESILALAEQAQAIGEITAAVNDVAEQTNLLALNAAIEASRAGEHGKGFAVVAGEVKALADQSKKATGQVRQILGEIQKATNAAVLAMEEVTKGVAAAGRVAGQSGEAIKSLTDTLTEASQAMLQIVASAGQQAQGMTQIHQAMKNIDLAARQNLDAMRQTEQAAKDLNDLGRQFTGFIGNAKG